MIAAPVAYAEICNWSPVTQREYLASLARQPVAAPAPRLQTMSCLPEPFPQLHFLIGSVSRWLAFAELPERDVPGKQLWDLRQRMAGYLSCHYDQQVQPLDVDAPSLFAEAVMAGLLMWVRELARGELISSWRIEPGGKDVVLLDLMPTARDCGQVRMPVRTHQLGHGGIDLLLLEMQQLFGPSQSRVRATA